MNTNTLDTITITLRSRFIEYFSIGGHDYAICAITHSGWDKVDIVAFIMDRPGMAEGLSPYEDFSFDLEFEPNSVVKTKRDTKVHWSRLPGVRDVLGVRVWTIGQGDNILTAIMDSSKYITSSTLRFIHRDFSEGLWGGEDIDKQLKVPYLMTMSHVYVHLANRYWIKDDEKITKMLLTELANKNFTHRETNYVRKTDKFLSPELATKSIRFEMESTLVEVDGERFAHHRGIIRPFRSDSVDGLKHYSITYKTRFGEESRLHHVLSTPGSTYELEEITEEQYRTYFK